MSVSNDFSSYPSDVPPPIEGENLEKPLVSESQQKETLSKSEGLQDKISLEVVDIALRVLINASGLLKSELVNKFAKPHMKNAQFTSWWIQTCNSIKKGDLPASLLKVFKDDKSALEGIKNGINTNLDIFSDPAEVLLKKDPEILQNYIDSLIAAMGLVTTPMALSKSYFPSVVDYSLNAAHIGIGLRTYVTTGVNLMLQGHLSPILEKAGFIAGALTDFSTILGAKKSYLSYSQPLKGTHSYEAGLKKLSLLNATIGVAKIAADTMGYKDTSLVLSLFTASIAGMRVYLRSQK